ncbi:MAG: ornithine carbamoyltransferase [Burkholderiaceae bacterium]
MLAAARAIGGRVRVTEDVAAGVDGADAVYGDIWVSMGQEAQAGALAAALAPYRITAATMRATQNPRAIFLHCLPALHDDATQFGREHPDARDVDDEVFEGPASRVFDQAENRMHTIKALMLRTLAGDVDLGPLPALDPAPALADTEA